VSLYFPFISPLFPPLFPPFISLYFLNFLNFKFQNLKDALIYAEQDIKDRWEWYKERFKKGMKK